MFKNFVLNFIVALAFCVTNCYATQKPYRERVAPRYQNAYESVCAIISDTQIGKGMISRKMGSGVLLHNGVIITNRHVVDVNGNHKLDKGEKEWSIRFTNNRRHVIHCKGKVIFMAPDLDVAVIRAKGVPKSLIKLATNAQYRRVCIGDDVYAIGFWLGRFPAHLTTGVISSSLDRKYGRSSTQTFYGGSGGGLFHKSSGLLIGLNSRISVFQAHTVPSWSEFVRADAIRRCLKEHKKLYLLQKWY